VTALIVFVFMIRRLGDEPHSLPSSSHNRLRRRRKRRGVARTWSGSSTHAIEAPPNKPLQLTVALPRCARSGARSWTPLRSADLETRALTANLVW